jgi:hypothetical protein
MHQFRIESTAMSLTGGAERTLLQLITPSTRRARLLTLAVGGSSVSASDPPMIVKLKLQGTAGTSSSITPVALDRADPAALCSGLQAFSGTEPSDLGTLYGPLPLTPVGGLLVYNFASSLGDEHIIIGTSTRLGIVANSPNALSNVYAMLTWQE